MAFNFNDVTDTDAFDEALKEYYALIENKFHVITDIPELCSDPKIYTTVQKKGYWEADRYFTMRLIPQLKKLGFEEIVTETKYHGNSISSSATGGLIGFLSNSLVFCLGPNENLSQPINLTGLKEEYKQKGQKMIENSPILVFQHYDGPIIPEKYTNIELDQEEYHCIKDAMEFKGVFKATKTEDEKYYLERIFDTYIFNIDGFWHFNPNQDASGIEVKYKLIKED